jgi:threonine/homoserine/homoserine lactone efflux protein
VSSLPVSTFFVGVSIGLAVAAPLGPMGLLCIQRTIASGVASGLAIGLAAATVQVTYGTIGVLGWTAAPVSIWGRGAELLSLGSAAILLWFAFRVLQQKLQIGSPRCGSPRQMARCYADALTVGVFNPLTVPLFFATLPALASAADLSEGPALVAGIFAGSSGWYLVLSSAVAFLRHRLSERTIQITNTISGVVLAALGGLMLAAALGLPSA